MSGHDEDVNPLSMAIEAGMAAMIPSIVAGDPTLLDALDKDGKTPLHRAVAAGKLEVVKALLKAGANAHAVDVGGATPLFDAKANCVAALVEAGAKVNAIKFFGHTAAHMAASKGDVEKVRALRAAGAHDAVSSSTVRVSDVLVGELKKSGFVLAVPAGVEGDARLDAVIAAYDAKVAGQSASSVANVIARGASAAHAAAAALEAKMAAVRHELHRDGSDVSSVSIEAGRPAGFAC